MSLNPLIGEPLHRGDDLKPATSLEDQSQSPHRGTSSSGKRSRVPSRKGATGLNPLIGEPLHRGDPPTRRNPTTACLNPLIGEPLHRGQADWLNAAALLLVSIPSSGNLFIGARVSGCSQPLCSCLNPLIGEPLHRGSRRGGDGLRSRVSIPSSGNLFIGGHRGSYGWRPPHTSQSPHRGTSSSGLHRRVGE